jgi:hypothetical protein
VIKQVHERLVKIARDQGIAVGRRMRVDTTVVETNIHYPTDSSLLGDGVRVLTRVMKKITKIAGEVGAKLRDRSRSVKLRVLDIARAARAKDPQSQDKLKRAYGKLLASASRVVGQYLRHHPPAGLAPAGLPCRPPCIIFTGSVNFALESSYQSSAAVVGYVPFPRFVPARATNFGGTTSQSVTRRNHAYA